MARINEFTNLGLIAEILEVEGSLTKERYGRDYPLRFCITGHLGRPRKDMVALIKQAGGEYYSTPKYLVDYLITNNDWTKNSTGKVSAKVLKAQRNGVKVIGEQEFYDMLMPPTDDDA